MRNKALLLFAATLFLAVSAWASSEVVIYNFNSLTGGADGYHPYAGLVADSAGRLYGTTYQGGSSAPYGVVFALTHSAGGWKETVLHSFAGGLTDGSYPRAPLAFDKAGNLYGTTYYGGKFSLGVLFELVHSNNKWTYKVLHHFAGYSAEDGAYPYSAVTFDSAGKMYGTTNQGGKYNAGTVYQGTSSSGKWTIKVIHGFSESKDGYYPVSSITPGANGYYYGTTYYGGSTYNAGVVYRLFQARGVWVKQNVFYFTGGAAGAYPDSTLTMDAKGNFYGTTQKGGANNFGTVYELKLGTNNKYTQKVLHSFAGYPNDGSYPYYDTGVVLDTKGNVYGTTQYGGTYNQGTVFELNASKGFKASVLHSFGASGDGDQPLGGLFFFNGRVFGTAYGAGIHEGGVVFQVTP